MAGAADLHNSLPERPVIGMSLVAGLERLGYDADLVAPEDAARHLARATRPYRMAIWDVRQRLDLAQRAFEASLAACPSTPPSNDAMT